jgi:lipoprotein signal peptidase
LKDIKNQARYRFFRFGGIGLLLVACDQAAKIIVRSTLEVEQGVWAIPSFLRIENHPNMRGYAFWLPQMPEWFAPALTALLVSIALLALPCHAFYTLRRRRSVWADLAAVTIFASALSHSIDEVVMSFTTDYLRLPSGPIVDLADVCSTIAISAVTVEGFLVLRRDWRGLRYLWHSQWRIPGEFLAFLIDQVGTAAARRQGGGRRDADEQK